MFARHPLSLPAWTAGFMAILLAIGLALVPTHTSAQASADLVVGGLSLTPSVARAGDTVTGLMTVRNAGARQADPSTVGLYLARWGAPLTEAAALGTLVVHSLAPGVSVQLPLSFPVPAVAPGYFQVIAMADVAGAVTETSDANNRRVARLYVAVPDLVVNALSVTPGTARAGDTVSVRVRVRNQGRVPAEATEGAIYFVTTPASALEGATPMLTFPVVELLPGASAETLLSMTVPSVSPASFSVVARADSTALVAEGSESNNLRAVGLRVATPNLTIVRFTATPTSVGVGETIRAAISLQNRAPVPSHPTTATLYMATAPDVDLATATHVATVPVPAVLPNRGTTLTVPLIVPPLPPGNQYLILQVDAATASNPLLGAQASLMPVLAALSNNPRSSTRFTLRYPDLLVTGLVASAAQVRSGDSVVVTVTVRNQGEVAAPSSTAGLFLDSGTGATDGLAPIATVPVGPLAARTSATLRVTTPVTAGAPGPYTLVAEADWLKNVAETNEGNNRSVIPLQVTTPPSPVGPLDLEPQLDPSQLDMPWPKHSHYKQPWRAWLETVPATRLRSGVGINYKWDRDRVNDAVELRLLAQSGFSRIRVEIGWNQIDYDTLDLTDAARAKLSSIVRGAHAAGIRPLILLNANHGGPGPSRATTRTVRTSAAAGSRSLQLDSVTGIQVGYTGISNLSEYKMAEVFITAINPATGTVTLSKPLPVSLAAGRRLQLDTLHYLPFYPPGTSQFDATAAGWLNYVRAVLRTVTQTGVTSFDVEIWNELVFGSDFLGINAYYDPPAVPAFNYFDPRPGSSQWELARRTVAMLASEFPSVTPIWGFSNTSFFQMPIGDLPPGIRGQSYHPYFFLNYQSNADEQYGMANNFEGYAPASPPYRVVMPETAGTYLKTESLARLINPAARNARPPGSPSFAHFMTEFGLAPAEYGVVDPEEGQLLKAKTLLRAAFFWLNKGLEALWFFEDVGDGDPLSFDLVPESVTTLSQNPPNPDAYMTPALLALRTAFGFLAGTQPVATPRPLTIEAAATDGDGGGIVFPGDASHPPLSYQDVLAVLPFQVDDRTFVLATYVMSRNILEPVRPVSFDVRISGLNGTGAQVRYVDPISGRDVPVQIIDRTDTSLTLSLPVADYPYVLRIEE